MKLSGFDQTGQLALNLQVDSTVQVLVLSGLRPMEASSALADDANRKRAEIPRLYPGARQVWVDSGHGIHLERPSLPLDESLRKRFEDDLNSP